MEEQSRSQPSTSTSVGGGGGGGGAGKNQAQPKLPKVNPNRASIARASKVAAGLTKTSNLLPSKLNLGGPATVGRGGGVPKGPGAAGQVAVGPGPGSSTASSTTVLKLNKSRTGNRSTTVVKPPPSKQEIADYHYGKYLQNLMQDLLAKEMTELEQLRQKDNLGAKCVPFVQIDQDVKSLTSKGRKLILGSRLALVDRIKETFSSLAETTGEEELLGELQAFLIKKYDKLQLSGANVKDPLFSDSELTGLLHLLRSKQPFQMGREKVFGLIADYVSKLKAITGKVERSAKEIAQLEAAKFELLEEASEMAAISAFEEDDGRRGTDFGSLFYEDILGATGDSQNDTGGGGGGEKKKTGREDDTTLVANGGGAGAQGGSSNPSCGVGGGGAFLGNPGHAAEVPESPSPDDDDFLSFLV